MKAYIYEEYGNPNVLQLKEVPLPKPRPNELLVQVKYTTVCKADGRLRAADFPGMYKIPGRLIFGLRKPRTQVLGQEFSGIVVAVGSKVSKYRKGDRIFGTTSFLKTGAYAEYLTIPENPRIAILEKIPSTMTFKEAAALPIGGMTALELLTKTNSTEGEAVLINGASGSVGTYAVQLALVNGLIVTACCSLRNHNLMHKLGVAKTHNYETKAVGNLDLSEYDIIFDAVGNLSKTKLKHRIKRGCRIVSTKTATSESYIALNKLLLLVIQGKLTPLISREFDFSELREAHALLDSNRKVGNIVVRVS